MHTLAIPRRSLLGLVPMLLAENALAAQPAQTLFIISRSTNENIVCYDARLSGASLTADPIVAYWIMRAEDGRHEALTWLERRFAYGFDVIRHDAHGANLCLSAFPRRTIRVRELDKRFRAFTPIAGRPAQLQRIHVKVNDRAVIPGVEYVDVYGRETVTGKALRERVRR